jgi:hypothetical protein
VSSPKREPSQPTVTWEADLPLVSRRGLSYWSLLVLVASGIMAGLLATVFATDREWDAMLPMLGMVAAVGAGLWLLGLAIMLVAFRGRYRVRYTISARGIACEDASDAARAANRMAVVAGLASRRPHLVGAGLIGASRGLEELRWSGAFRAVFDARRHQVILRNAWRTLMWVQCTRDNFDEAAAHINFQMRRHGSADRVGLSPLPAYLGRSALAVAASVPLFQLAREYETGVLVPVAILCFALAAVWLVNLFGWVVIAGLAVQAALTAVRLLASRESALEPGTVYRAYEVLGGADLVLLGASATGTAVLVWLSARAVRGRWLAALVEDAASQ